MSITPVTLPAFPAEIGSAASAPPPASAGTGAANTFESLLTDGLSRLDTNLQAASQQLGQLAIGDNVSVQDVMITMEKAKLSLDLAVQIRNRLVNAYQEFMRMQV